MMSAETLWYIRLMLCPILQWKAYSVDIMLRNISINFCAVFNFLSLHERTYATSSPLSHLCLFMHNWYCTSLVTIPMTSTRNYIPFTVYTLFNMGLIQVISVILDVLRIFCTVWSFIPFNGLISNRLIEN